MDFTNEHVSPEILPQVELISFHPLEKKYLTVNRIALLLSIGVMVLIAIGLYAVIDEKPQAWVNYLVVAGIILILIFSWIGTNISFSYSGYALRDKDILVRTGWLVRKIKVLPLNRVQHVSVQSGPLERNYGLASVSVFTAGTGAADFTIRGITQMKAQQIKDWISNRINENNPS